MKRLNISLLFFVLIFVSSCSSSLELKSEQAETINQYELPDSIPGSAPIDLPDILWFGGRGGGGSFGEIDIDDVEEYGLTDDIVNDYGIWGSRLDWTFCDIGEFPGTYIEFELFGPDSSLINSYQQQVWFDEIGGQACVELSIDFGVPSPSFIDNIGPYELRTTISDVDITDKFNVFIDTLIIRGWEPDEKIRIAVYRGQQGYLSEIIAFANSSGELWLEIPPWYEYSRIDEYGFVEDEFDFLFVGETGNMSVIWESFDYNTGAVGVTQSENPEIEVFDGRIFHPEKP